LDAFTAAGRSLPEMPGTRGGFFMCEVRRDGRTVECPAGVNGDQSTLKHWSPSTFKK
jgi:hypothetical protein